MPLSFPSKAALARFRSVAHQPVKFVGLDLFLDQILFCDKVAALILDLRTRTRPLMKDLEHQKKKSNLPALVIARWL